MLLLGRGKFQEIIQTFFRVDFKIEHHFIHAARHCTPLQLPANKEFVQVFSPRQRETNKPTTILKIFYLSFRNLMTANSMDEKIFKLVLLIAYSSSSLAVGADDRAGILLFDFSFFTRFWVDRNSVQADLL